MKREVRGGGLGLLAGDGASSNENGRALITEKLRGRRAPE